MIHLVLAGNIFDHNLGPSRRKMILKELSLPKIEFLALCCRTIFETTNAIGIKVETQLVSLKDFYVAAGFNLIGEIKEYPPGMTTYVLIKRKL